MSGLPNIARAGLLTAATTLVLINAAAARAQQLIPEIIISSTIPANGDLNPYGVAFVPPGFSAGGPLQPGDILVSNFNNSAGLSGTGTTIVRVTPAGQVSLFFNGNPTNLPPPQLGLTTALGVLKRGFVLVGNLPTTDGSPATIQKPGSLLVINHLG